MGRTHSIGRKVRPALVLLPLLGLLAIRPALAEHEIKLTHLPPRIAAASVPQTLAIVVRSACDQECAPVRVTLTYKVGSAVQTMSQNVINLDAGATTFTIPGTRVVPPSLVYFIEASRTSCSRYGFCREDCHKTVARWPTAAGSWHTVRVMDVSSQPNSVSDAAETAEGATRSVVDPIRGTPPDTDGDPVPLPRLTDVLRRLVQLDVPQP